MTGNKRLSDARQLSPAGLILRIKEHLQRSFHKEARSIIPLETLVELHCDAGAWAIISGLLDCYHRPHRGAQAADTAM